MGTRPRTPEHFPRMKIRSDRRRLGYAASQLAVAISDLFDFVQVMQRAISEQAPKIREDLDTMIEKMRVDLASSVGIVEGTSFETAGPVSIPFENGGLVDGSSMVTIDEPGSAVPADHPALNGLDRGFFDHDWMWSEEERDQAEQNLVKRMSE